PPRLWRNDADPGAHFLTVKLRGRAPNTEGIGATVTVRTTAGTQRRLLRAGSNFESQDPAEAHFGLGGVATVDELRVDWLAGTTLRAGPLAADRFVTVAETEGSASPCAGGACIAGGGDPKTDCLAEWRLAGRVTKPRRPIVTCRDGDPLCDTDPAPGC